jgi:bifunctional non-homologous end joining protein LigD
MPRPPEQATGKAELAAELKSGTRQQLAVEIEGKALSFTNLNKVYFPEDGYTKRDLLLYYLNISPFILPFLKDRPLVLRRYPNGIASKAFFQKDAGDKIPDWIQTAEVESESKRETIRYFLANDLPTLLYLTNLGCIDHNPWSSRGDDQEHPDYIFFDLDPSEGTPFATVIALAKDLSAKLESLGLKIYIKTSGATGIHIFIPVQPHYTFEQVRKFVEVVAAWAVRDNPGRITSDRTVSRRPKGSIYVDAHQNSRGQSLASVYSVRAFPHAPVSTPILPSELTAKLRPDSWTLKSIPKRMEKVGDLWANFWKDRQDIETAVENLSSKL